LDEPTVGLDPKQIIEVRHLIKSLANQHTIILSTHILPEVSMTCDRVTIIHRGKIIATNTPENLLSELTGNTGYKLEIEGNTDNLESLFKQINGITQVMIKPLENQSRAIIEIRTDTTHELGREIANLLIHNNLGLYEMRRNRATLEDVFLNLITTEETIPHNEQLDVNNTVETE
jgi:ABC-2 type transport system ATP-binding protein